MRRRRKKNNHRLDKKTGVGVLLNHTHEKAGPAKGCKGCTLRSSFPSCGQSLAPAQSITNQWTWQLAPLRISAALGGPKSWFRNVLRHGRMCKCSSQGDELMFSLVKRNNPPDDQDEGIQVI